MALAESMAAAQQQRSSSTFHASQFTYPTDSTPLAINGAAAAPAASATYLSFTPGAATDTEPLHAVAPSPRPVLLMRRSPGMHEVLAIAAPAAEAAGGGSAADACSLDPAPGTAADTLQAHSSAAPDLSPGPSPGSLCLLPATLTIVPAMAPRASPDAPRLASAAMQSLTSGAAAGELHPASAAPSGAGSASRRMSPGPEFLSTTHASNGAVPLAALPKTQLRPQTQGQQPETGGQQPEAWQLASAHDAYRPELLQYGSNFPASPPQGGASTAMGLGHRGGVGAPASNAQSPEGGGGGGGTAALANLLPRWGSRPGSASEAPSSPADTGALPKWRAGLAAAAAAAADAQCGSPPPHGLSGLFESQPQWGSGSLFSMDNATAEEPRQQQPSPADSAAGAPPDSPRAQRAASRGPPSPLNHAAPRCTMTAARWDLMFHEVAAAVAAGRVASGGSGASSPPCDSPKSDEGSTHGGQQQAQIVHAGFRAIRRIATTGQLSSMSRAGPGDPWGGGAGVRDGWGGAVSLASSSKPNSLDIIKAASRSQPSKEPARRRQQLSTGTRNLWSARAHGWGGCDAPLAMPKPRSLLSIQAASKSAPSEGSARQARQQQPHASGRGLHASLAQHGLPKHGAPAARWDSLYEKVSSAVAVAGRDPNHCYVRAGEGMPQRVDSVGGAKEMRHQPPERSATTGTLTYVSGQAGPMDL